SPTWKESFLHPATSTGIVVQVAQEGPKDDDPEPTDLAPAPRHGATADLLRIVHLVPDLDAALRLFAGPLDGQVVDEGDDGGPWIELRWPGPGRLRLRQPSDEAGRAWLGERPGRLHHVAFAHPTPERIDGVGADGDRWVVEPSAGHGVRWYLSRT
ncbi:MAG: VOC family protein, partial [Actinomycetota bacterium]